METRNKTQFVVLLVAAAWVSVAVYTGYDSYGTPDNANVAQGLFGYVLLKMLALSLPAVLFGSILFWWFGKSKP
jgi:hypothetical protein